MLINVITPFACASAMYLIQLRGPEYGESTQAAAAILQHVDVDLRSKLMCFLDTQQAAAILECMKPPPAADTVDHMEVDKAAEVLEAMNADRAGQLGVDVKVGWPPAAWLGEGASADGEETEHWWCHGFAAGIAFGASRRAEQLLNIASRSLMFVLAPCTCQESCAAAALIAQSALNQNVRA